MPTMEPLHNASLSGVDLSTDLARLAGFLADRGAPPHAVFGSAALAWHLTTRGSAASCADEVACADIDLMLEAEAARKLLAAAEIDRPPPQPAKRFRSDVLAKLPPALTGLSRPLDIMGGFAILEGAAWRALWPIETERVAFGNAGLNIATLQAQAELFERFGRPKDLERLSVLRRRLG